MSLILTIENVDRLQDGGPLRVEVTARGLDIGRDQHLDWTLPDPTRHVSGKHCEVRYQDGGYWLHDVSTNGTFVNGAEFRSEAPYRLRHGDRLAIGHYIVAVAVTDEAENAAVPARQAKAAWADSDDPWGSADAAPPVDRREVIEPKRQENPASDFLDWAVGIPLPPTVPAPIAPEPQPVSLPRADEDWFRAPIQTLPEPPEPPPMPSPRRPAAPPPDFAGIEPPAAPAPERISATPPPPSPLPPPPEVVASAPVQRPAPPPPPAEVEERRQDPPAVERPPVAAQADVIRRLARAAGIPEDMLAGRDPNAVADEIGAVLNLVARNLTQLLASRAETKSLMRSSSRTMIAALENNPLKFSATPEEALRLMFGPPTGHYTDARTTIDRSFADLKAHQVQTFAAMQAALEALFEDFAPERIEKAAEPERGLGGLVGSRKARLWDIFVERWKAKTARQDGRLTDAFMLLFAESYDRLQGRNPPKR